MSIHANSRQSHLEHEDSGKGATYRMKIMQLLQNSDQPLTDRQIIDILGVTDVNNVRPEITRLKQRGIIREVDTVKCPDTGKTVRRVHLCTKFPENAEDAGRRARTAIPLKVLREYFDSVEEVYEEAGQPIRMAIARRVLNDLRALVNEHEAPVGAALASP